MQSPFLSLLDIFSCGIFVDSAAFTMRFYKLSDVMARDDRYRSLGRESAELINVATNSKLKFDEKEGKIDMCKAIEYMRRESEEKGEKKGENKLGSLMAELKSLGRIDDAFEAAANPEYREKLYKEFKMA